MLLAFSLTARAGGLTPLGGSSESIGAGLGDNVTVERLSDIDQHYMDSQRNHIDSLAKLNLGERLTGDKSDLDTLQDLLDQHIVASRRRQYPAGDGHSVRRRHPQATADGVGNLQGPAWALTRLRLGQSSHFLFPVR